ncbi:ARM repeat-containing protein, partial [Basidiobolus meristosporus CBS 931.73]
MTPTRSLWIGNIDSSLTTADLMSIFSPYGPIESLRLLPEKECAFVNYVKIEDAIRAREEMQGGRVGNCIIRVGYGKADIYTSDAQTMQPTRALWIGNISASITPAALQAVFAPFGAIESARILTHKNCGFVNFEKVEDAAKARKEMNNKEIYGSAVRIGYAKVPPKDSTTSKIGATPFGLPFSSTLSQASTSMAPWSSSVTSLGGNSVSSSAGEQESSLSSALNNSPGTYETVDLLGPLVMDDKLIAFPYASSLPPIPEPNLNRKIDQSRLREIRKRLDSHTSSAKDVESAFHELYDDSVDLCSDYIGNTVIQKLMERGGDSHKLMLIERVAPHMASIGIHKNGTWAIQKMIDCASTPAQMQPIVNSLKPFAPPLLLDQFGNYVIQCCLRLGPQRNQFIYDAIHARCWEVAQGRFGARAIRACLESQYTTKRQQRLVSVALVHNALLLATNPNGSLLLTWLLDSSNLAGRYRALAPQFINHLSHLCTHKLASLTFFKMINQKVEPDARDLLLQGLFMQDQVLEDVLSDQVHGVGLIQKILASNYIEEADKGKFSERVKLMLGKLQVHQVQGYRRLMEEL